MVCVRCMSFYVLNTLRPRQNGRHFPDDNLKHIFLNGNVWISIKISLKFVPRGPINNIPALVQIMAWCRPGDKSLSEPMMVRLPTHICVTRPQWVKDMFSYYFKITEMFDTCTYSTRTHLLSMINRFGLMLIWLEISHDDARSVSGVFDTSLYWCVSSVPKFAMLSIKLRVWQDPPEFYCVYVWLILWLIWYQLGIWELISKNIGHTLFLFRGRHSFEYIGLPVKIYNILYKCIMHRFTAKLYVCLV